MTLHHSLHQEIPEAPSAGSDRHLWEVVITETTRRTYTVEAGSSEEAFDRYLDQDHESTAEERLSFEIESVQPSDAITTGGRS